jgi:hypothetical protein
MRPEEPPTKADQHKRVAQRVVSQRSSNRIVGARLLNTHAKIPHLVHESG